MPITYKLASAPVITYVPTNQNGGSFEMVDPKKAGIEDEPCWKLLGYNMYHESQFGRLLTSPNDIKYVRALEKVDLDDIVSIFGFFHEEYLSRTENPLDIDALYKTVCGEDGDNEIDVTFEGYFNGSGINSKYEANTTSLLTFCNEVAKLSKKHDLRDTFIAHQQGPRQPTKCNANQSPSP